ncbi:hypothetical protein [Hydrogenibacillus sp. N12]|uniref:hypothetical protein n=1 Tax=Hydrogenibacillus sp. N12 TaxID=2866627 RepID=UPI001C7D504E|nr:hypothetical protein [Hydrogenibacillus sp. N12]QZA32657.1 hypothetical protein K2M58_10305 [Hydrogenibacillus sp. N12]
MRTWTTVKGAFVGLLILAWAGFSGIWQATPRGRGFAVLWLAVALLALGGHFVAVRRDAAVREARARLKAARAAMKRRPAPAGVRRSGG